MHVVTTIHYSDSLCPSTFLLHPALPQDGSHELLSMGYGWVWPRRHQNTAVRWGHSSPTQPSSLPAGPWLSSDYFPLLTPTAPAKGPRPVPKDPEGHTPCLEPHSTHTFANDPFIMLFLTTPSDSCKDHNQHSNHHHGRHHPGFPVEVRTVVKTLAVSLTPC